MVARSKAPIAVSEAADSFSSLANLVSAAKASSPASRMTTRTFAVARETSLLFITLLLCGVADCQQGNGPGAACRGRHFRMTSGPRGLRRTGRHRSDSPAAIWFLNPLPRARDAWRSMRPGFVPFFEIRLLVGRPLLFLWIA